MGYKVKWVEEHLGVSRKALRGFEKAGLMPKNVDRLSASCRVSASHSRRSQPLFQTTAVTGMRCLI